MSAPITLIAQKAASLVIDEIRDQIRLQGHNLTGSLSKSVEAKQVITSDGVLLQFLMNEYGVPLNQGVKASRIPYGKYTGAKVSKYIQGLKNFAKLRFRVGEKQALGIAFAIANKQIKEGMPTRGSYAFTKTGMRTMFIEEALRAITPQLEKVIGNLETEIINTI